MLYLFFSFLFIYCKDISFTFCYSDFVIYGYNDENCINDVSFLRVFHRSTSVRPYERRDFEKLTHVNKQTEVQNSILFMRTKKASKEISQETLIVQEPICLEWCDN